jgi:hypothetical protein
MTALHQLRAIDCKLESKMRRILLSMFVAASIAAAQQPQTSFTPTYDVNAKYTNGTAPGYWPTQQAVSGLSAATGLTLNLSAGTAFCGGSIVSYSGGTKTMTASTTNYVYLNTGASCVPSVKTTAFVSADIPIATVIAGPSTIILITDDRTMFQQGGTGGGGGGSGFAGVNPLVASYTAVSGDNGKELVFNCPTVCSLTLPTTPPSTTWSVWVQNISIQAMTFTVPTGLTLDGLGGVAQMNPNMGTLITTDGTNYFTQRGAIITRSSAIPVLVQKRLGDNCTGNGNCSVAYDCGGGGCNSMPFASAVTAGNALVLHLFHANGGTISVSDSQGDTFTSTESVSLGGEFDFHEYVVCNAIGGPTTVSFGSSPDFNVVVFYEVTNVALTSCVDGANSGDAENVASVSTGAITTTTVPDFIIVSGMGRTGTGGTTITEGNSYTSLIGTGLIDNALTYNSWQGVDSAAGSVSDLISYTNSPGGENSTILALKPTTTSTTIVQGDLIVGGPNGSLQPLHPGTSGNVLTSNGPGVPPSFQPTGSSSSSPIFATGSPIATGTPSVIQRTHSGNIGSSGVTSLAFGSSVTSGHVVWLLFNSGSGSCTPAVSDSRSTVFTSLVSFNLSSATPNFQLFAGTLTASGADTVYFSGCSGSSAALYETNQVSTTIDNALTSSSGSSITLSVTTTFANDFLISFLVGSYDSSYGEYANSPWSSVWDSNSTQYNNVMDVSYQIATSTGAYPITWTTSASSSQAGLISFKSVGTSVSGAEGQLYYDTSTTPYTKWVYNSGTWHEL